MRGSGIMLRRLNDALPGLVLGIIVYGAAVFLAGIWFVPDKLRFTTGLAIGIALACGMAVNMAVVLRDAVEIYGEAKAGRRSSPGPLPGIWWSSLYFS